jgi:NO-binding membrane sensor protein with MHYT domain
VLAAVPATLAAAIALALPTPENVTVFLGALGLGLGLGVGFYIERVGKAKVKAFKEYDAAFRGSSLARAREAERLRDEMLARVRANTEELAEKSQAAEAALMTLAEQSLKILTDFGYVRGKAEGPGEHAPQQAPDADRRG